MLCKNCGAPVSVNEFTGIARCEYCDAVFDLTGAKVDFSRIHDYLEKIRYFKNKGVLVKPKIKVINGKVIYPDQLSAGIANSYTCVSCGSSYSMETIVRHMLSSHPELIESSKTIPYFRNHPELVSYLRSLVRELEQKEIDLKKLKDEYAGKKLAGDRQEERVIQFTGRYLLSYAASTFARVFFKLLIGILSFFVLLAAIIFLFLSLFK